MQDDMTDDELTISQVMAKLSIACSGSSVATYAVVIGAVRAAVNVTHVQADGRPAIEDVLGIVGRAALIIARAICPATPAAEMTELTRLTLADGMRWKTAASDLCDADIEHLWNKLDVSDNGFVRPLLSEIRRNRAALRETKDKP